MTEEQLETYFEQFYSGFIVDRYTVKNKQKAYYVDAKLYFYGCPTVLRALREWERVPRKKKLARGLKVFSARIDWNEESPHAFIELKAEIDKEKIK